MELQVSRGPQSGLPPRPISAERASNGFSAAARSPAAAGVLLADDMGLGKTLATAHVFGLGYRVRLASRTYPVRDLPTALSS